MPPLISGIIQTCQVSCILHDPYAFFPKLTFTHTHTLSNFKWKSHIEKRKRISKKEKEIPCNFGFQHFSYPFHCVSFFFLFILYIPLIHICLPLNLIEIAKVCTKDH